MRNKSLTSLIHNACCEGLYIHVPFCFHKCHYCDFYSIVDKPEDSAGDKSGDRQHVFTDALVRELRSYSDHFALRPKTIFVGGGTPTLLRPQLWRQLLAAMRDAGVLEQVEEFTVEANPETVTPELMDVLVAGGVNRVSMGAQSFQPHLLKALERWHDPATVSKAARIVQNAGISNINLDLIFAIPSESMADLDSDLDTVLSINPTHLSCYSLIFEPHTPLTMKLKLGQVKPVDEDIEQAMFARVIQRLADAGFEHYEVSNWAKHDPATPLSPHDSSLTPQASPSPFRCQHNMMYWQNKNWLGVGPSAASHIEGMRWKNLPHLGKYTAESPQPPVQDEELLPLPRRVGEQLMLRLRLREGVPLAWLTANLPADDERQAIIKELVDIAMLERTPTHLRLTERGLFVADSVIAKLL